MFGLVAHFTALEISPSPLLSEDLLNFFAKAGAVKQGTVTWFTLFTKANHSQLLIFTASSSNPLNHKSKLPKDLMYFGHCRYINKCCKITCILRFHIHHLASSCINECCLKMGVNNLIKWLICNVIYYPIHPCIFCEEVDRSLLTKQKPTPGRLRKCSIEN